MHIKSAANLLLIASLANAYTGDIECQQADEAFLALEQLGFVATAFCSSFLEPTIATIVVTPTVYVDTSSIFFHRVPNTLSLGHLLLLPPSRPRSKRVLFRLEAWMPVPLTRYSDIHAMKSPSAEKDLESQAP